MFTTVVAGLRRGLGETFTNTLYLFFHTLWVALLAIIFFHVWENVLENPGEMLAYIAIAEAFYSSMGTGISRIMEIEYNEGRIDYRLIRPVPLVVQYLSEAFGVGLVKYTAMIVLLTMTVEAYAGVSIDLVRAVLAYPLYSVTAGLIYFIIGTFVVDLGRASVIRWIVSKIDMVFLLVPREVLGDLPYLLPNAFAYYYPARFVLGDPLPLSWFAVAGILLVAAIVLERRMKKKIEVFGG